MVFKKASIYVICISFSLVLAGPAFCQNHIREMDAIRSSMGELGNKLPPLISKAQNKNLRTLERIFEINNYSLTTIESYFKMMKIVSSSSGTVNKEVMDTLNSWLEFINNYSKADMKYLDEALAETDDPSVMEVINIAKVNVQQLIDTTSKAIDENMSMLK